MKFRMVSEYDYKRGHTYFWTERKEFLIGWWMVVGTMEISQAKAEEHYFKIVSSNGKKAGKEVIHESWKLHHDR